MPDVVKHAWTHRPRAQGGTDPIETAGLIWATAGSPSTTVADVSNIYRLTFDLLWANDATAFEAADVTAGRANYIQLNQPGFYIAKFCLRGTGALPTTSNSFIQPTFESVGSPAQLDTNLGINDYLGTYGTALAFLLNADTDPESHLFTEIAFEWDPANPQDAIDDENPLKIGLAFSSAGAPATIDLAGDMFFVRLGDVGMVDLSP